MAEHTIETRILLRYDTYTNWMNSNVILKKGEAAICSFPNERVVDQLSDITPGNTPPAIGIKIGDNFHYFRELPWVQAVAADVYQWAKTSTKPTYTASEISGLQSFIEENFHISGDVTIAPRIYQIIEGTEDNANKYFLRYKENNEDAQWITDTNHPIDLSTYQAIADWIGNSVNNFPSLGTFTGQQTRSIISNLSYTDTAQNNKFVTSVSESGGIISVEKAQPTFSNIAGKVNVTQGGTGLTSITENNVLVGDGENQVKLIPIAESIENNDYLVTNRLVKTYVDKAVAGLSGAMHYIGEATVEIHSNNSTVNPQIDGYNFQNVQYGDVITYGHKEFVWEGYWRLLGDEGSYAIKGSITDADISDDAAISQSKIANLDTSLEGKVDKVAGKTLTSNDFTDELKQKLEDIGTNAETNVIEHIYVNDDEVLPTTINGVQKVVNLQIQEFDDQAQQKLASIETGAQKNIIEKVIYDGEEITPDENKIITITSDPHTEHENKIESIVINGVEYPPNNNKEVKITIDEAALDLQVIKGAVALRSNGTSEPIEVNDKILQLAYIAKTGNINDIIQKFNTYVILDCGSSTDVVYNSD